MQGLHLARSLTTRKIQIVVCFHGWLWSLHPLGYGLEGWFSLSLAGNKTAFPPDPSMGFRYLALELPEQFL